MLGTVSLKRFSYSMYGKISYKKEELCTHIKSVPCKALKHSLFLCADLQSFIGNISIL
jgi:hypothetical protein